MNEPARPAWVSASAAVNVLDRDHLPFKLEPGEEIGPYCGVCACYEKCPDRSRREGYPNVSASKMLFDEKTAQLDHYHKDLCIYLSDKDTHDNAMALVEYDNGSRAFHSEVFITARDNREYVVIGDQGHLEADLREHTIDIYPRWTHNRVTHHVGSVSGGHGGSDPTLMGSFLRAIQKGERPLAGPRDGVWSLAVGCAAEIARVAVSHR